MKIYYNPNSPLSKIFCAIFYTALTGLCIYAFIKRAFAPAIILLVIFYTPLIIIGALLLKTKNKKKDEETTVSKNCEVNSQPIHTTGVMSLEKQLSSTFSVGYFLQIKNGIDTEAFSNMQNLLNQPFNVLQKNLAKCQTIKDKIQTKLTFINHLIGLATEIGKSDKRYWGFITFMETTYSKINPIFDEVVDYMTNNTTIEYNDDENEDLSDEDYLIVNGKASEMFWSLFHALSESEAFLNCGMCEMSDKWYALLNNEI